MYHRGMNIPLRPHKGKTIYCIVDDKTGDVIAMYKDQGAKAFAQADCPKTAHVVAYTPKPEKR